MNEKQNLEQFGLFGKVSLLNAHFHRSRRRQIAHIATLKKK
jgi:hypothetical protein